MRFDIIIGNPPYQSATGSIGGGSTPLYIRFVQRAQQLVTESGIIALVTPPTAFKIGMGGYVKPEEVIKINNDAGKYFRVGSSIWYFIQQRGRAGSTQVTKNGKSYDITIKRDTILTAENSTETSILDKIQRYSGGASMSGVVRDIKPIPLGAVFFRRMNRNKTFNAILTYSGMEENVKLNQDYTLVHPDAAKIVETLNTPAYTFLWTRYQTSPFITLGWIRKLNVPITDNIYSELGFTAEEIRHLEGLNL